MIIRLCVLCFYFIFGTSEIEAYPLPKQLKTPRGGIPFWFLRNDGSEIVSIRICFQKSGSAYQPKHQVALPMFYEICLAESDIGDYTSDTFQKECNNLALSLSCYATMDNITFAIVIPKKVIQKAIKLLHTFICHPKFAKPKVENALVRLKHDISNYESNPEGFARNMFLPMIIYRSTMYQCGIYGSLEDCVKLTIDDIKSYKSNYLVVQNAIACVVGDISEEKAGELIDNSISDLEYGKPTKNDDKQLSDFEPKIETLVKKYYAHQKQSTVAFAMPMKRPLSETRHYASLLCNICGGASIKSKLLSKLRSEEGLVYSSNIEIVDYDYSSYIVGFAQTKNENVEKAIKVIKSFVSEMHTSGISKEELKIATGRMKGNIIVNLTTSEHICGFYFSSMKAGHQPTVLKDLITALDTAKIDDINLVAKELFDPDKITFIVIGGN